MEKNYRVSSWAFNGVYLEPSILRAQVMGKIDGAGRTKVEEEHEEEKGGTVKRPHKEYQTTKIQGGILQFNFFVSIDHYSSQHSLTL